MRLSGKNTTTDKWEKKYFSLLDEHDALEQNYQHNEALLCKTITRLALASTGFNKALDPHLKSLRKQLQNGLKSEKLKRELEEFSNALLTLDEHGDSNKNNSDPALLFEFLVRHFPKREAEFHRLEKAYQQDRKAGMQDLLLALHELVDEEHNVVSEIHNAHQDDQAIRRALCELLADSEIPESFKQRCTHLTCAIENHQENLPDLLDKTFSLLLEIKKYYQSAQQETTTFLASLSEELTQLGWQASHSSVQAQHHFDNKQHSDQIINSHMTGLQDDSANAVELEKLKLNVRDRMKVIAELLQAQQQQELTEHQQNLYAFQTLLDKIRYLENESERLQQKLQDAQLKALRDPLTQLPNRLAYDERLLTEQAKMKRNKTPLSLLVWDIDFFKKINDTYGHKAGDKTLMLIAKILKNNCRESDFIARFGGEEFVMLLAETHAQSGLIIADKIRTVIESSGFNYQGHKIQMTISCGISEFTNDECGDTVFKRADRALYLAKQHGRNQCIIAAI